MEEATEALETVDVEEIEQFLSNNMLLVAVIIVSLVVL